MSRLSQQLAAHKAAGRKALIPYITAGDPAPQWTVDIMHALVAGGADVLEVGVPFSDPMADGPVIQAACERALAHDVGLADVLAMVREFRNANEQTPVVLMGYLNPVEAYGYARFASDAVAAGVDAVLLVDLSAEEAQGITPELHAAGLETVFLVAPTTASSRLQAVCAAASGFVYYVSRKGVTGSGGLDLLSMERQVAAIRSHSKLSVAVGFGISDAQTACQAAEFADAVVIGSALVSEVGARSEQPESIAAELQQRLGIIRAALDQLT